MSFRIATNVAIFTLASSPLDRARISIMFPLSDTSTLSLSFSTTKLILNLPSLNSARYSLVSISSSLTSDSILYASKPFVLNAFLSISSNVSLSSATL